MMRPEVWAGLECTVNRVGDQWRDQFHLTGHYQRPDDIDRLASLGIRAVRYPLLWEKCDWAWTDQALERWRHHGVRVIAGLIHHGSGPVGTSLIDDNFAEGLANHAQAVIERYPWLDAFTPVNEPLTTARFSGLYGFWYPHAQNDRDFVRCLVNQCKAVALSMQAIRSSRPDAQLIQTEDLGQTHALKPLHYQAEFENHRRWLTWDLLAGRVTANHPLYRYLRKHGISVEELGWFETHPCPPDVIGINHYLTSERYLDSDISRHAEDRFGGNGQHRYADVEAVRVGVNLGIGALLDQAWQRYQIPLAITECHLGCTREEQLRWLEHVWGEAQKACERGVDLRAVTAWSAFGACDWNSLVTRDDGYYESGLFDIRSTPPRATAMASWVAQQCRGEALAHPVLEVPGWWQRADRFLFAKPIVPEALPGPKLLIAGAGNLGQALERICQVRGLPARLLNRSAMDIADPESVRHALHVHKPWAVINAAGYVHVNAAETDAERCRRDNAVGPMVLAQACAEAGLPLLTFSSDLVFDGQTQQPYRESDPVAPLNVYGACKAEAEFEVQRCHPEALIIRTSPFFSPWSTGNFPAFVTRSLQRNEPVFAANDLTVSPTYLPDLCHAALDLLIDGECGLWHVASPDAITWYDLARAVGERLSADASLIHGQPAERFGWAARRPAFSALGSHRGSLLPPLARSLDHCLRQSEWLVA